MCIMNTIKNTTFYYYLNKQGVKVSHSQVRQAALIRGWNKLRQQLQKRFTISAESI